MDGGFVFTRPPHLIFIVPVHTYAYTHAEKKNNKSIIDAKQQAAAQL